MLKMNEKLAAIMKSGRSRVQPDLNGMLKMNEKNGSANEICKVEECNQTSTGCSR